MTSIWAGDAALPSTANADNTYLVQTFTATAGQTLFTLSGFAYQTGTNSLEVFVNGVRQFITTDYTETSNTSFTLTTGVEAGDLVAAIGIVGGTGASSAATSAAAAATSAASAAAALAAITALSLPSLPLTIANGGTGATTAANALKALLTSMTGNSGKLFTNDGTDPSWTDLINTTVNKFADGADTTKRAQLILSAITAGQTRNITVPDGNVTLQTDTQRVAHMAAYALCF